MPSLCGKPQVLILSPDFPKFSKTNESKFTFLKPSDSDLPKSEYLSLHSDSIRAAACLPNAKINSQLMDQLPKLGIVVAGSAGTNHIDLDECRKRNVKVCYAGEIYSDDVADYAVGLLIDVLRGVSAADRFVRANKWISSCDFRLGSKLGSKRVGTRRVGIVGLGSIGLRIAKRLEPFGCTIHYNSRAAKPSVPYKYFPTVLDLAKESDVLILTCTLTSQTYHIVNKDVMSALGKKGVIINVGRGTLIDEQEMVRCLIQKDIGGVGLDVVEDEPNVPKELLGMENVVLSPHTAAVTHESFAALEQLVVDNLEAFFLNKPLVSPVLH